VNRLGVLAALPAEARAAWPELGTESLRERLGEPLLLGEHVLLVVSGIGPDRAQQAAAALLERGARALLSFGVAGGLDPSLRPGALVVATETIGERGERLTTDGAWRARASERLAEPLSGIAGRPIARVVVAPIAESACVVHDPAEKRRLAQSSGAAAVDMESAALARCAARAGLPYLALRAVCDSADMPIPVSAKIAVDGSGRLRLARLLLALIPRPLESFSLIQVDRAFRAALATLAEVAGRARADGFFAP
jgi:adenosylhomocysteine nucleosidase